MDRNVEQGKKKKVNEPRDRLSNGRKGGRREEEDFKRWRNEIHENATKCLKGTEKTTTGLFPMLQFQSHAQSIRGYKSNNRSTNCIVSFRARRRRGNRGLCSLTKKRKEKKKEKETERKKGRRKRRGRRGEKNRKKIKRKKEKENSH